MNNLYLRLAARRLLQMIPTMLGVVILAFCLLGAAKGDLADVMAAEAQIGDQAQVAALRKLYGIDVPLPRQISNYLLGAMRLDLGYSFRHNASVTSLILERLPATLLLLAAALGFAVLAGTWLGIAAARRHNTTTDAVISTAAAVLFSVPSFWLSVMLVVLFSVKLQWFPVAGMQSIVSAGGVGHRVVDIGRHLFLPAFSLGLLYAAIYARVTRASMLGNLKLDFVRTAKAKGLPPRRIVYRHVLRNALLPVVTLVSLHIPSLFAGAVVVESVFSWPGLGSLLTEAVGARNYPVVMGTMIFTAGVVLVSNLVVDLLYLALDPRVRM
jgi:peptide/nickel transport system permease protein